MTSGMDRRRLLASGAVGAAGVAAGALGGGASAAARPGLIPRIPVRTGMDRQAASNWNLFRGRRIGILSNHTGVDREYRHLVDRMHADGVTIGGVFGPEHGFRGSAQAGGSEGTGIDARTGLTVYDAYLATAGKWDQM